MHRASGLPGVEDVYFLPWVAYNGIKEALHWKTVKAVETLAESSGIAIDHEG
jgi:hypothetical protein